MYASWFSIGQSVGKLVPSVYLGTHSLRKGSLGPLVCVFVCVFVCVCVCVQVPSFISGRLFQLAWSDVRRLN